ncbi:MAG: hypothetical protein KAS78_06135, partial [Candidatus Pacebacteria bacterium]|nr:hypothetical protein [Candidatus Paceibacterota bacterium]
MKRKNKIIKEKMFNFSIQCARRVRYITKAFIIFYAFVFLISSSAYDIEIIRADSSATSVTIVADSPPPPPSGGGGGTIPIPPPVASVIFSGRAYPKRTVTLLKDAQVAATTVAGLDANFQIDLSGLSSGNYIFSIYSEDGEGRRSSLFTFPISIAQGATTKVGGIFISPTIDVDKSEVKKGDNISIFGQSVSEAEITIEINSDQPFFDKIKADEDGVYLYNFDTSVLKIDQHFTKSKSAINGEISPYSQAVSFKVGTETIDKEQEERESSKGNLNDDNKVNLIDFSIMAFWYNRSSPPDNVDLNSDHKID